MLFGPRPTCVGSPKHPLDAPEWSFLVPPKSLAQLPSLPHAALATPGSCPCLAPLLAGVGSAQGGAEDQGLLMHSWELCAQTLLALMWDPPQEAVLPGGRAPGLALGEAPEVTSQEGAHAGGAGGLSCTVQQDRGQWRPGVVLPGRNAGVALRGHPPSSPGLSPLPLSSLRDKKERPRNS